MSAAAVAIVSDASLARLSEPVDSVDDSERRPGVGVQEACPRADGSHKVTIELVSLTIRLRILADGQEREAAALRRKARAIQSKTTTISERVPPDA